MRAGMRAAAGQGCTLWNPGARTAQDAMASPPCSPRSVCGPSAHGLPSRVQMELHMELHPQISDSVCSVSTAGDGVGRLYIFSSYKLT